MKRIAFSVQKGGTGKSTSSINIARGLSIKGYKVALVDCDPQGNSSTNYITEIPGHELADVLNGKVPVNDALVPVRDKLFMLPTYSIDGELRLYGETKVIHEPFIFQDLGDDLEKLGFDYAIYDLSPGFGSLERSVLIGCNEVITPILPEYFSLDGIKIFLSELEKLRKSMRAEIRYEKVIINNVNLSLGIHVDMSSQIVDGLQGRLTPYIVPQDVNLKNAQAANVSIYDYTRAGDKIPGLSRSVEAYEKIVGVL